MTVLAGNPSFIAAAIATPASRMPSVLESDRDLSSRYKRPLNKTRNPKPLDVKASRLPSQVFEDSFGGALSQYPAKENVCRNNLRAASPGYMFRSKPR